MESRIRNNYFVFVKALGIIALAFDGVFSFLDDPSASGLTLLISAVFLLFAVMPETEPVKVPRKVWLIGEGAASIAALFLFPSVGICFTAITYLDVVSGLPTPSYLGVMYVLPLAWKFELDLKYYFVIMVLLVLIYYQHNKVIGWYARTTEVNLEEESKLKSDIEHSKEAHKNELYKSRLQHENELLEEKGRISQALHDKLGHSINGSLYKLEAAKVLVEKDPAKSTSILQEVIDNLRGSMDEIRVIIRNERPDKSRLALKSLQALLSECEEEYGIKTSLEIDVGDRTIPENIWEIILDNTFEAVTNALKYSGCDEIKISINALGEVVRATISDNGKGADNIEESMGIQGMKARVRKVKGYMDIDSIGGFTINMILPLESKKENADGSDQSTDS